MISLETAKALKEAGWLKWTEKYTYWCWANVQKTTNGKDRIDNWEYLETEFAIDNGYDIFPCPSTDELLAELPSYLLVPKNIHIVSNKGRVTNEMFLHIDKGESYWAMYTDSYANGLEGFIFEKPEFSECLAQLWLKLKKEDLIK